MAGFLINVFKTTDPSTFKKDKLKEEHFEVARTRKCAEFGTNEKVWRKCAECGSDEKMKWLALHPSIDSRLGNIGSSLEKDVIEYIAILYTSTVNIVGQYLYIQYG